jgi:hypothetical protein
MSGTGIARGSSRFALGFAALALLALNGKVAAQGESLAVKLTIEEPAGVARIQEPAGGGIPLPAGRYKKDHPFALFAGAEEVPAQVVPLVTDEKGFLRWVLVDTLVDLAAGEKKALTLKAVAPTARPAQPLKVTDDAAGVTVDTGKLRFSISKAQPFTLLSAVSAAGKPVTAGGEVSYTDAFDGKRYVADKPESVVVEYAGALRTTVCVRGRFAGDEQTRAQYIARITAWAGRSDVHVKYALANSNPEHYCYRAIAESTVALKLAAPATATLLGAATPIEASAAGWLVSALQPGTAAAAKAGDGDKELWAAAAKEKGANGWILAKTAAGNVWACDLYFADDPARKLAVVDGALRLSGVTKRWRGVSDDKGREAGAPYAADVRWLHDCSHLSSQYRIDFAATGLDLAAAAPIARSRLMVAAEPAWYSETQQLHYGRFGTQEDELACYETWGWKYDKARVPSEPGCRIPRFISGEDNHYESEHDNLDALALMWLRTGNPAFFQAAEAMANYYMDLQSWRTDGWRYRDGGVWWATGPLGNRPQRAKDPVTGSHNGVPGPWAKEHKEPWNKEFAAAAYRAANSKACYCHNWGEGLTAWYCLTGDRDTLEAAIDCVEQNYDSQRRAFKKEPGKTDSFSRDFTRSCYLVNATRLVVPEDPFVVEASDYLAQVYFQRPRKDPRGMVSVGSSYGGDTDLNKLVGPKGVEAGEAAGVTFNPKTREVTETATGRTWTAIPQPNIWMYPPLSRAMGLYHKLTGSEDAMDFVIAYGQMAAHVLWQERHGLQHGSMLADWPAKGVVKDFASWNLPDGVQDGEGMKISGYLSKFHPDVCARAYAFTGETFLKQRAFDYWDKGSHRLYNATKMSKVGEVAEWVNHYGPHAESVCFTSATFHEWANPRQDTRPPKAIADLKVVAGPAEGQVTVSFTAPADEGGGQVARYQVKCSDKPLLDYLGYLKLYNGNKDEEAAFCNWWMAANLQGEPGTDTPGATAPKAPGATESFVVSGVPTDARHFAVVSFDNASNRSGLSPVAQIAGK